MTNPLDKMNLRPFEKRLVVAVGLAIFLVINAFFVFPHFSDWGKVQGRMTEAQEKLKKWQDVTREAPSLKYKVDELQRQGIEVPPEDQTFQFNRTIEDQARQCGVNIIQRGRVSALTNQFFVEQSQSIAVQAGEQQLVEFLYNLGAGDSLIRVRDLGLRPDPPRQALSATVKLVASFQKKSTGKGAPALKTAAK